MVKLFLNVTWSNGNIVKSEIRRLKETRDSLRNCDPVCFGIVKHDFVVYTIMVTLNSFGRLRKMDNCNTPWWLDLTNSSRKANRPGEWWLTDKELARRDRSSDNAAQVSAAETSIPYNVSDTENVTQSRPGDTSTERTEIDNSDLGRYTSHDRKANGDGVKYNTPKGDRLLKEKILSSEFSLIKHKDCGNPYKQPGKKVKVVDYNAYCNCKIKSSSGTVDHSKV